ncbi:MAG TPA: dihydroneopterin aldolase [Candidatus Dormibacteraeota bacterium]|nr:dihydroneopterin aldolase [Candidatus Dormibacteraeota bacterium]
MPTKRSKPTGCLILSGLTAFGYHGNNPAERKLGQTFTADLEVVLDTERAAASDSIHDTVSYPRLEEAARKILEGAPANLLETVAERIAAAILKQPAVVQVTVRVSKRPPLPNLEEFAVEITRPVEIADLPQ